MAPSSQEKEQSPDPGRFRDPFDNETDTWTYERFARDVAACASGLARRGVSAGDRVIIHLDNCPEFLISWFACGALGAIAVTTNTRSVADELGYIADDCEAIGAITQPRYAEMVSRSAPRLNWLVCTNNDGGHPLDLASGPDRGSSFAGLLGDPDEVRPRRPNPLAPMSVQYTSGTTARPKGVVWTHANALWGARVNAAHEALRPDDRHLVYAPLFHTNALAYSMLPSMWVGATIVLLPKWSSSRFWDISVRNGCTWLSLVGYAGTVLETDPPPDHRYRLWGAGVGDLPFEARFGVKTIGWWGMTETISHPIVGDPHLPGRPMAVGRPAPEYSVAVVDENDQPVEPGEPGHLLIKGLPGLSLFAEYLNKPDMTAESFDDLGWFRTGDLVTPGTDGSIDFAGRSQEMLKVGGENVAALEVERVVMSVAGVKEVAVVPMADVALSEVPVAYVISSADDAGLAERIIDRCKTLLADFKIPRAVIIVPELPRVTLGKVDKRELTQALEEGRTPIVTASAEQPDS